MVSGYVSKEQILTRVLIFYIIAQTVLVLLFHKIIGDIQLNLFFKNVILVLSAVQPIVMTWLIWNEYCNPVYPSLYEFDKIKFIKKSYVCLFILLSVLCYFGLSSNNRPTEDFFIINAVFPIVTILLRGVFYDTQGKYNSQKTNVENFRQTYFLYKLSRKLKVCDFIIETVVETYLENYSPEHKITVKNYKRIERTLQRNEYIHHLIEVINIYFNDKYQNGRYYEQQYEIHAEPLVKKYLVKMICCQTNNSKNPDFTELSKELEELERIVFHDF